MSKIIYTKCSVCGAENKVTNTLCDSCGAKFDDLALQNKQHVDKTNDVKVESKLNQNTTAKKKKIKKSEAGGVKHTAKILNAGKLFYLILALVLFGLLNLYLAGVFDSVDYVAPTVQQNSPDPHQGADLSSLQEINNLQKLVDSNPGDYVSLLKLAHMKNDSGFFPDAIKNYQTYLKLRPNEPDVIVDMGVCYYQLDDFNNAIATMKKALQLNPKHQIAHFNIGIVNFAANNKSEAITWWKKAIEIDPNTNIAKKAEELINSHQ